MRKHLLRAFALAFMFCVTSSAHASLLEGEALEKAAEIISWVVIIVAPLIAITVFWVVHVMPEKIAEDKGHPQAKAIQVLCLLSLVFGGLLWPIAWLWAYTKPVIHQIAYGTDRVEHGSEGEPVEEPLEQQVQALREQLAALNVRLAGQSVVDGEDA